MLNLSAKINELPYDLKIKIYEYNVLHRTLFKECMKRVCLFKVLEDIPKIALKYRYNNLLNLFDKQIDNTGNYSFEKIINTNVNDIDYLVKMFGKCKCCVRHNISKPLSINQDFEHFSSRTWDSLPSYGDCQCECRHLSRFLYKCYHKTFTKNDKFSNAWVEETNISDTSSDDDY